MTAVRNIGVIHPDGVVEAADNLVACDHCGIVAINVQTFGWKFFYDTEIRHHCPAAIQYNELLAGGLIHGTDPNDAIIYGKWPDE